MIDANILKILMRTAPNYHIVADSVAKSSSVCVCSRCRNSVWDCARGRHCLKIADRLKLDDYPIGYSRVDANGTCDKAIDPQLRFDFKKAAGAEQVAPPAEADADYRMEGGK